MAFKRFAEAIKPLVVITGVYATTLATVDWQIKNQSKSLSPEQQKAFDNGAFVPARH